MAAYDRQLLTVFLAGDAADAGLRQSATDLAAKAAGKGLASRLVEIASGAPTPALGGALRGAFAEITPQSRLYIVGRGDWARQEVSGWGPRQMADLFAGCGMPPVARISIVADAAGRDRGTTDANPTTEPADSFAARFHHHLRMPHGIETEVVARVHPVAVLSGADGAEQGRKVTLDPDTAEWRHHARQSKVGFRWENGEQKRHWSS